MANHQLRSGGSHQFEAKRSPKSKRAVLCTTARWNPFKGKAGVEEFAAAYDKLLDEIRSDRTQRIVIVSPTPFQKSAAPLLDLSALQLPTPKLYN